MAFLYSRSRTWRRIVQATQGSALNMALFGAACFALPAYLGSTVMGATNSPKNESELEKKLRAQGGLQAQVLAQAQKERLQVLLDEVKEGGSASSKRYQAALDGQSLGTHSSGTTANAQAIRRD